MTISDFDITPQSVVAVFAHPDDADVACGATLARWSDAGAHVHLVVCTAGDKGRGDDGQTPQGLAEERSAEIDEAARILGVEQVHRLDHRDGEFDNDLVLRRELVTLMRALRPSVLICPDPLAVFFGDEYYNHRDHRVVGFAALDAAAPAAAMQRYFPECGPAHQIDLALLSGSLEPSVFVDVATTIERKARAVACHRSQLEATTDELAAAVVERARTTGAQCGAGFAEAFRRISLAS